MAGKRRKPDKPCCTCENWKRKALDWGECRWWDRLDIRRDIPKLLYAWDDGKVLGCECRHYGRRAV